jgi:NAD kinase
MVVRFLPQRFMPDFKKIYCVIKRSEWDYYQSSKARIRMFNRVKRINRDKLKSSHDNQSQFITSLQTLSEKRKLNVLYVQESEMDGISPDADDLVISCGGDGTFLSCAQKYQDSTLLGMNSDFNLKAGFGSFGALTTTNLTNLESHLDRFLEEDYSIDHWNRLQVKVNGKLISRYAVNDIYCGHNIAYQTCDISVVQSGMEQDFNCSGILCCTGMGSHAWHYNAGGSSFSNDLDAFGFRVLFPNLKIPMKFSSGIISSRHDLIMIPQRDNYIISFDSKPDVIETQLGDEVRVSLAKDRAVRVVLFDNAKETSARQSPNDTVQEGS